MTARPTRVAPLRAWGIVRGRELSFDAALTLEGAGLALTALDGDAGASRTVRIAYATLDGAGPHDGGALALYLPGGDVIELTPHAGTAAPLADAAGELARRARQLPELTHGLRALGSERARPGSDHDRFFGPLLAARLAAESGAAAERQLAAFDATPLRAEFEGALAAFATDRFPETPPDRRALGAELHEAAEPLWSALDILAERAVLAAAAPDDARFVRWREWAQAVRGVYVAADRVWMAVLPALADSRGQQGRFWRRLLRRR